MNATMKQNKIVLFRVFCGIRSIGMIATLDKPSFMSASMRALSWELKGFRRNINGIRTARDQYGNVFTFSPYWKSSLPHPNAHTRTLVRFNPKRKPIHDDAQDDGGREVRRVGSQRDDRESARRVAAPHLSTPCSRTVHQGKRQAWQGRRGQRRGDARLRHRHAQGKVCISS